MEKGKKEHQNTKLITAKGMQPKSDVNILKSQYKAGSKYMAEMLTPIIKPTCGGRCE